MSEFHDLLDRRARGHKPPPDLFERVRRRSRRRELNRRLGAGLVAGAIVAVAGLGAWSALRAPSSRPAQPAGPSEPSPTATPEDIMARAPFAPLEPGTFFIDPDQDPSTPLRVVYDVRAEGWSMWIGATKEADDTHVGVSITTVKNVVRHGCHDHSPADPPVGPSVGDLATALADLAPFRVTSPPTDVTIYGYRGKHLELTVPNLPTEGREGGCVGATLQSWIAPRPVRAFYGHTGPGYTEEFWILDVEGTRLVIVAHRSPDSPRRDLAELRAILGSISIEPAPMG